jgi:hypothetical protein
MSEKHCIGCYQVSTEPICQKCQDTLHRLAYRLRVARQGKCPRCGNVDNSLAQVRADLIRYLTSPLDSPTLTPSRDDEAPRHEARDGGASC